MQHLLTLSLIAVIYPCMAATDSRVLVVNMGDSTASIYSPTVITNGDPGLKLLKVLPVGKTPNEACVSPDGKRAYVSNRGETSVTVIDLDALKVVSTLSDPAMKNPDGCIVNAEGTKLYVAAAGGESVLVFSTSDGRKVSEIATGHEPRRLLLSQDGGRLYVTNGEERYLTIADTKTNAVIGKIKTGRDGRPMAFTPGGKYLAIGNVSDDTIEFVKPGESDPEFVVGVPKSPQRLVLDPVKQILFSIGRVDNVVSMLDVRPTKEFGRFMSSIPAGRAPWGLALSAAGDCLYVTNTGDSTLSIIDLRVMKVGLTMPTGKSPMGVAVR